MTIQTVHDPTAMTKARTSGGLPTSVDVAIVGAGTAGLMAGAELSTRGLRVALFDPHYVAGGCGTQFSRGTGDDQYRFDIGLHYVGDCGSDGVLPTMLSGVGVDVDFLPMDPDGFDTLVFPDLEFRIPACIDRYRERLVALFPSEKRGIDRYLRLVREVMHVGQRIVLNGGKVSLASMLQVVLRGRLLAMNQNTTMEQFLDTCTKDPRLRAIILGQNGDYALPPSQVSALLHCGLAAHFFAGAYYPRGGGQIISDRLAEAVESRGGSIHLRCGIEQILVEDGRAVGVRTELKRGKQADIRASAVLSAADLNHTLLDLLPRESLPAKWHRKVENFTMPSALFLTFLGVEGDLAEDGMRATNYWQFDDYDFEAAYQRGRASDEIEAFACYVTSSSLKDPGTLGHAPPGKMGVEVLTLVEGSPKKWGVEPDGVLNWKYKKTDRYLETKQRIEDDMVRRFLDLFPSVKGRICFRESATPVTHMRYTRASSGSGYGLAGTPDQSIQKRPGYDGPVPGLFLSGMSTRGGHGIVGALISGRQSAKRVASVLGAPG